MSLVIRDNSVTPRDGWSYYVEATNYTVTTRNPNLIYSMVVKHCLANGINPPTEQQVIDWQCQNLNIPCHDGGNLMENSWSLSLPLPPRTGGCCG